MIIVMKNCRFGVTWTMQYAFFGMYDNRYLHCGCYSFSFQLGNLKTKNKKIRKTKQYKIVNHARNEINTLKTTVQKTKKIIKII